MLHSGAVQADTGALVRLSFPQGVHPDVTVQPGELTIGSAPDNRVVLKADGIRPHHATIVVDNRGTWLFLRNPDAQTHVNARPVREKAILRLGDIVTLEAVNILVKPAYDETVRGTRPTGAGASDTSRQSPPRAVLRGVAGPYFGKVVPIQGRLTIGRGKDCDLVLDEPEMGAKHATLEVNGTEIALRDVGTTSATFVNGVQVSEAVAVFTGDQLAFDRNRFLIEAPGMPVRRPETKPSPSEITPEAKPRVEVTQTMRAIRPEQAQAHAAAQQASAAASAAASQPAAAPSPRRSVLESSRSPQPEPAKGFNPWWLLVAAALIAAGIAFVMLR